MRQSQTHEAICGDDGATIRAFDNRRNQFNELCVVIDHEHPRSNISHEENYRCQWRIA